MPVTISVESPRQAGVIRLLEASNAYAASLYPADSNHLLDLETLEKPNVTFFVARRDEDIVGCCALVNSGDMTGEIKRMFVDPDARGLKISKRIMDQLVLRGLEMRLRAIRLETGIYQPEAIRLYRSYGFREIGPFGSYKADPLSLFMEKELT
ncbi:GNAT family N-acetyltransferase [Neorhizobium alkalisoli]|uniref:Putative acetyltransferase n=1 Tax=Neorhizobium alkalisoli TaxID=528178 RepID=A0A561R2V1_9HYPH|nr:GNAT family N-acetyltransferase [Neorhizobium alkalisoli]TWF56946.1 putative acetyltransferase [Neorhizobium alkalisoli]